MISLLRKILSSQRGMTIAETVIYIGSLLFLLTLIGQIYGYQGDATRIRTDRLLFYTQKNQVFTIIDRDSMVMENPVFNSNSFTYSVDGAQKSFTMVNDRLTFVDGATTKTFSKINKASFERLKQLCYMQNGALVCDPLKKLVEVSLYNDHGESDDYASFRAKKVFYLESIERK